MLKSFKIYLLSWLVFHGNRGFKSIPFYDIKNRIIKKHGVFIRYDVQHIPGKECYSCNHGVYDCDYDEDGNMIDVVECYKCDGTGWYKLPVWNILEKFQLGKYCFHQPYKRTYKDPEIIPDKIEGYIKHNPTKYTKFARLILFLLYNRRCLTNNIKSDIRKFRYRLKFIRLPKVRYRLTLPTSTNNDDLPF